VTSSRGGGRGGGGRGRDDRGPGRDDRPPRPGPGDALPPAGARSTASGEGDAPEGASFSDEVQ
ncbi:MAG TPA: hypothetical protein VM386_05975, partial [Acidimicrobiales bacterium]|nr:hypothetical protein [Acidimicrobiales bacterium]